MFFVTSALVLFLSTFSLAAPTDATASNGSITKFTLNGSGCPAGSTTTTNDGSAIVATFSQFTPDVSNQSFRQNCQASIEVAVPAGKKFTVDKVAYNGFAQLDKKVSAVHGTTVYFQAELDQQVGSATLNGPVTKEVDLSNTFGKSVWSKCGGSSIVNIDISVYLTAASDAADGFTSVDNAKFGPFKLVDC